MKTMRPASIVNAPDSTTVCYCGNVTKGQIVQAVVAGNRTFAQLRRATGACPEDNDCATNNPSGRCCAPEVMALLKSQVPDMQKVSTQLPSACCSSAASSCCCPPTPQAGGKSKSQPKKIAIDFLYLDLNTCERCIATGGTLDQALAALAPAFQTMGYVAEVNKVNITTKELAEQYRFISSPTIRVNGVDICTELKESDCKDCGDLSGCSVDCRVFVYEGEDYEQPPAAMIIDGIMRVLHGAQTQTEKKPYTLPDNLIKYFEGLHGHNPAPNRP